MVGLREMARADAERVPPSWLVPLLEAKFFEPCPEHPDKSRATRSGGCNLFCIDCNGQPLCHDCIAGDHTGHQLIQVRKSSKHNVVKVKDVEALLGLNEVQTYHINNKMVVFLNPRPQTGNGKAGEYRCRDCDRALLDKDYRFCSLKCKLECMEWDIDISFAVQSETESESSSSEDDTDTDDDDALSRPIKRLRITASRSGQLRRGNLAEEDGAGTSGAPTASLATPASSDPSTIRHQ